MKKILLSTAFVMAACCGASAQKLSYVPYTDNALMMGGCISENGRYIGGCDTEGRGFIYDTKDGQIKYFVSPNLGTNEATDNDKAQIYSVTNEGVGAGCILGKAADFNFATGKYTAIFENAEEENAIAKWTTPDGAYQCGVTYDASYKQMPFVYVNGEKADLPTPTDEWLGFETGGFLANYISNDGSLIVGGAIDNYATYPLIFWVRNRDGKTYSVQTPSKRFLDASYELNQAQPYAWFEGGNVSANGKWIAMNIQNKDIESGLKMARFNVDTEEIEILDCPDVNSSTFYYSTGIANDGTVIGYTQDLDTQSRRGVICLAGEKEVKYLSEAYPTITDFLTMDEENLNTACAITPDGRYVTGFGYKPVDENNDYIVTWCLDREEVANSIEGVANSEASKVVASYTTDGKRVNRTKVQRGLVINRLANGKAVKNLKK